MRPPFHAILLLILLGTTAHSSLRAARMPDDLVLQVLEGIGDERRRLGRPDLERRDLLHEAAARRARRIAALPEEERMSRRSPVEEDLHAVGMIHFHRARAHLDLQHGGRRPAASVLERWRGYGSAWEEAMAADFHAVGAAAVQAADGWIVFVAILVEEQELAADPRTVESQVRGAVDRIRGEHGLPPLEPSELIADVARAHSRDMVLRGFFDHLSPDGESLGVRLRKAKIGYRRCAENISLARGVKNPVETAVAEWMASPGHRDNILDPTLTHTGVGLAVDDVGTLYFTQVFVLPAGSP